MKIKKPLHVKTESILNTESVFMEQLLSIEPDVDLMSCIYCLHYKSRADALGRNCKLSYCPCLTERIQYGMVNYTDFILDLCHELKCPEFSARVMSLLMEQNAMKSFMNKKHKTLFFDVMDEYDSLDTLLMAALYLLTADEKLWQQAKKHIKDDTINFKKFKPQDCSTTTYSLFCVAKDLYKGSTHCTLADLADSSIVTNRLFNIICNAFLIRVYGIGVVILQ